VALAGLVYRIRGLRRSGRLGGPKAAVTGIVGTTLVIALGVIEFILLT
jgi:hypothetical protein